MPLMRTSVSWVAMHPAMACNFKALLCLTKAHAMTTGSRPLNVACAAWSARQHSATKSASVELWGRVPILGPRGGPKQLGVCVERRRVPSLVFPAWFWVGLVLSVLRWRLQGFCCACSESSNAPVDCHCERMAARAAGSRWRVRLDRAAGFLCLPALLFSARWQALAILRARAARSLARS